MGSMGWSDITAAALLGTVCLGCGHPGRPWCGRCLEDLYAAIEPHQVSGRTGTVACSSYAGCLPAAVVGFKDRNVRMLGPALGDLLAAGIDHSGLRGLIVPAPSSPAAVRRRGFDHTAALARFAGERLDLPTASLLRSRRRKDQAGLSPAARRRNLEGSMWTPRRGQEAVIVIDDVCTSGATLAECGRALGAAGWTVAVNVVVTSAHG